MTRSGRAWTASGVLCVALFAFAFIAAPSSCEWGLDAYFWSGVASLVLLFAAPFVFRVEYSLLGRAGFAVGLLVLGAAVWFAGLFIANVRIMCRLF